jgi:hypothetical protein
MSKNIGLIYNDKGYNVFRSGEQSTSACCFYCRYYVNLAGLLTWKLYEPQGRNNRMLELTESKLKTCIFIFSPFFFPYSS